AHRPRSARSRVMDTDRNLLFGALALQADLIDTRQFAEICLAWTARKDAALADLLVERGWLDPSDRADVEKLLARKLKKHGGDAHAGLAEMSGDHLRQTLTLLPGTRLENPHSTLVRPSTGQGLLSTIDLLPGSRDRYTLTRLHATGGLGRVWLA